MSAKLRASHSSFNTLAEQAKSLHVADFEALQHEVGRLRKGTIIGVVGRREAFRAPKWAGGHIIQAKESIIPAVFVRFDGERVTVSETDEHHGLRFGALAQTTPKQTMEVGIYDVRALPHTRFSGTRRRR